MSQNNTTHLQQLQSAVQLHQSGQLASAEAIYRGVLLLDPKQPDALHYLGMLLNQTGNADDAIAYINASILVSPGNAIYFSNLGTIYTSLRDFDSAAAAFRNAIRLNPTFTTAILNLGCTLKDLKRYPEAIETFRAALAQNPKLADAFNHVGEIQTILGAHGDAEKSFLEALRVSPHHAPAMINFSSSLIRKRQFERAATFCRQAILIKPDAWGAVVNLGVILIELKQYRDARQHFTNALAMTESHASPETANLIRTHLGIIALYEKRLEDAFDELSRANELIQTNAQTHATLAVVLKESGQLSEAIGCFRKSIALDPGNAVTVSNYLMTLAYDPACSREYVFAEHKLFGEKFEKPFVSSTIPLGNTRDGRRKLRVGYVSGDLWNHVVSLFFEPILLHHDKSQFHVTCFSNSRIVDPSTERLMALADNWISCRDLTDDALHSRIRQEKIDILVDLSGHTGENRLRVFARRAAPIQMTWIGYAGTTGLSNMDYRISDEYLDARGVTEDIHTETLIRLPGTQAAFKPAPESPDVNALPSLSEPRFVFSCLNGVYKLNLEIASVWSKILASVPNSFLMLGNVNDKTTAKRIEEMMAVAGIDGSRLLLHPRMPQIEYLRLHHQIDLALDPFPYNGGTTTWHSLWMGVPVVTLAGTTPVSRCGATVLGPLGLNQFIAQSEAEYIDIAVNASKNLAALAKTRADLRTIIQNSPSNDPAVITRNLERAYRAAWAAWCNGTKLGNDFRLDNLDS